MKKIIFIFILTMISIMTYGEDNNNNKKMAIELRVGSGSGKEKVDVSSNTFALDYESSYSFSGATSISLELTKKHSDNFHYGLGVSKFGGLNYNEDVSESLDGNSFGSGDLNMTLLYMSFKKYFSTDDSMDIYIKANLGLSLNSYDGDTSMYYDDGSKLSFDISHGGYVGLGIGTLINDKIFLDLMFETNSVPIGVKVNDIKVIGIDDSFNRVTFYIGYNFDLNTK